MSDTSSKSPTTIIGGGFVQLADAITTPSKAKNSNFNNKTAMSDPSNPPVQPKPSILRFPVRIGITWAKGAKLESQDFSNTWYPSKIVEVDEEQQAVLIHFEGWNQRYDEWFTMDSDRLRPSTRHSERKDQAQFKKKKRIHCDPVFRSGDEVLARWKDCKKYPAKISRMVEDGLYEVVFYDGVTYTIQATKIQLMSEEMKKAKIKEVPPSKPPSSSFRNVKVNLPASLRKKKEAQAKNKLMAKHGKSSAQQQILSKPKFMPKVNLKRDRELDVFSVVGNKRSPPKQPPKEPSQVTITCEATVSTLSEEECLKLFGSAAMASESNSVPSTETTCEESPIITSSWPAAPVCSSDASTTAVEDSSPNVAPATPVVLGSKVKKTAGRMRKRAYTETNVDGKSTPPSLSHPPRSKRPKRPSHGGTDGSVTKPAETKKSAPPIGSSERSKSLDMGTTPARTSKFCPYRFEYFFPAKSFVVEEDHNPFKCPHEGCLKGFRKESLLQSHIKYYHSDQPDVTQTTATATFTSASITTPSPSISSAQKSSEMLQTASRTLQHSLPPSASMTPSSKANNETAAAVNGKDQLDTTTAIGSNMTVLGKPIAGTSAVLNTPLAVHKRRRRKTDSFCSTDSEISSSSKKSKSKRQRNDSEISVTTESPEVAGKEKQTASGRLVADLLLAESSDHKEEDAEEFILPDTEEVDEDEMASDVVNCVCGLRHTVGLMIQCEICLCWQHFKCTDVNKTGQPPANYVCGICQNPKGVRHSSKFLHDLGWERRGELPTFPFKSHGVTGSKPVDATTDRLSTLAAECNDLLATVQGMKRTLHSTRRQIKLSKEEEDPEFQLWQTDWDNWIKPEEEINSTMTPCPADPEGQRSPQSANFLFPQTFLPNGEAEPKGENNEKDNGSLSVNHVSCSATLISSSSNSSQSYSLSHSPIKPFGSAMSTSCNVTSTESMNNSLKSTTSQIGSENRTAETKTQPSSMTVDISSPLSIQTHLQHEFIHPNSSLSPSPQLYGQQLSMSSSQSSISPASSLSSSNKTPPMMLSPSLNPTPCRPPPQTPSIVRSVSCTPIKKVEQPKGDNLVKYLFPPGPGGDASSSLFANENNSVSDNNLTQVHVNALAGLNDASMLSTESTGVPHREQNLCTSSKSTESIPGVDQSVTHTQALTNHATGKSNEDFDNCFAKLTTEQKEMNSEMNFTSRPCVSQSCDTLSTKANIPNETVPDTKKSDLNQIAKDDENTHSSDLHEKSDVNSGLGRSVSSLAPTNVDTQGTTTTALLQTSVSKTSESDQHSVDDGGDHVDVVGATNLFNDYDEDDEDTQDGDTDTAEESADPYQNCEHNLLVHIQRTQNNMETELEEIEARILEFETSEHNNSTVELSEENILNDLPALKKSLSKLAHYLKKIHIFTS